MYGNKRSALACHAERSEASTHLHLYLTAFARSAFPSSPYMNFCANLLYPHIYRVEPPKGVAKLVAVGVAKRNLRRHTE